MANNKKRNAKWTIMIYMAVDDANGNNEALQFFKELDELKNIIPSLTQDQLENREVRIVLQAYANWSGDLNAPDFHIRRYEVNDQFDTATPLPDEQGFTNTRSMGDANVLDEYIKWCDANYKADHYMLFLWGHGSGSSMFSLENSFDNVKKYCPDLTMTDQETNLEIVSISELKNLFKRYNKKELKINISLNGRNQLGPSVSLTVVARETDFYKFKNEHQVETVYDLVRNEELSDDLEKIRRYLSARSVLDALLEQEIAKCLKSNEVDILLIVGCCMQMVEFAYEIRKVRNNNKSLYYIASEELIYFDGYNYKSSFTALADNPDMAPRELLDRIIKDAPSKESYNDYQRNRLAISGVDLTKSEHLANLLSKFSGKVLSSKNKELWGLINEARNKCRHFGEEAYTSCFIDIVWFFKKFADGVINEKPNSKKLKSLLGKLKIEADEIIRFLKEDYIVENYIGFMRGGSLKFPRNFGGHGVAIYFPSSITAYNRSIKFEAEPFDKNSDIANDFTKNIKWAAFLQEYLNRFPNGIDDIDYLDQFTQQESANEKENEFKREIRDLKNIIADLELKIISVKSGWVEDLVNNGKKVENN